MAEQRFKPRAMMEKAIEVMLESVAEPRTDGKASPKVGAVLIAPDNTRGLPPLVTACRGELREGDHAEFTLIERKCRDKNLRGSVLFATLEPCAPGARRHPKLCCAERIVNARIAEVWVGIEDPDPTVDRKGIKFLEEHGVKIHLFDADLQEQIRDANREFIAQAMERKAAAELEQPPQPITLSLLENSLPSAGPDDFSPAALARYREAAGIADAVDSPAFFRRLELLGLVKHEGGRRVPTGFGVVLFGSEPRLRMPQVGVLGTIHHPEGREDPREFDGPQVLVPEQSLGWLRDKLPDPISRTEAERTRVNDPLFELAREGIVNAIVHRDYDISGAKCHLIVTPDTLVVKSPGRPQAPITLEQLQSLTASALSRNPILHYVFSQMKLAEERGLGLKSMRQRATAAGLPPPTYTWEDPYLVLTIYRSAASATRTLPPAILSELNEDEKTGWQKVVSLSVITTAGYAEVTGYDHRKAQRHLKRFMDLGLLSRKGSGKSTRYERTLLSGS